MALFAILLAVPITAVYVYIFVPSLIAGPKSLTACPENLNAP